MNVNHQISRGMERLMAQAEGARLSGLYGLSGMGVVDNFRDLETVLTESGLAGMGGYMDGVRGKHRCACDRMVKALPVAVDAFRLVERNPGETIDGLFSKVKSAVKKVTKAAVKLSPSHALIKKVAPKAAILSPSMILANKVATPDPSIAEQAAKAAAAAEAAAAKAAAATTEAARAKAEKSAKAKADKAARLQAKADASAKKKADKAAAKLAAQAEKDAKAAEALKNTTLSTQIVPTPAEAAAAVLATQSGVTTTTPAAQQFAQEVVSNAANPGSTMPSQSLFAPPSSDAGPSADEAPAEGSIFGMSPLVAAGAGALALGGLYLLTRKR